MGDDTAECVDCLDCVDCIDCVDCTLSKAWKDYERCTLNTHCKGNMLWFEQLNLV